MTPLPPGLDGTYTARRRRGWCGGISPIDYEHQKKINNPEHQGPHDGPVYTLRGD